MNKNDEKNVLMRLSSLREDLERINSASQGKYSEAIDVLKDTESQVGSILSSQQNIQENAHTQSLGMGLGSSGSGAEEVSDE